MQYYLPYIFTLPLSVGTIEVLTSFGLYVHGPGASYLVLLTLNLCFNSGPLKRQHLIGFTFLSESIGLYVSGEGDATNQ